LISAVGDGWSIWVWLMLFPATLNTTFGYIAAAVIFVLVVVGALAYKRNKASWDVLAGAPAEAAMD
jgi:hypothetical protein